MRNPETLLQPTPEATQDTGSATESAKEPVPTREVLRQTDAVTDLLRKELDALEEKLRFAEREKEPKSLFSRVFTAASPKAQEVLRATIAKRRSELEQLEGLRRLLDRQERIKLIDKFPTNRRDLAHAVDPEHAELKDVLETSWYPPRKLDVERMAAALEAGYDAGNSAAPLRILDLGGGRGFLDKLLADHLREKNVRSMVVDLDLDPEELAKGKAMYGATANLHFVASDADNEVGSLFST